MNNLFDTNEIINDTEINCKTTGVIDYTQSLLYSDYKRICYEIINDSRKYPNKVDIVAFDNQRIIVLDSRNDEVKRLTITNEKSMTSLWLRNRIIISNTAEQEYKLSDRALQDYIDKSISKSFYNSLSKIYIIRSYKIDAEFLDNYDIMDEIRMHGNYLPQDIPSILYPNGGCILINADVIAEDLIKNGKDSSTVEFMLAITSNVLMEIKARIMDLDKANPYSRNHLPYTY